MKKHKTKSSNDLKLLANQTHPYTDCSYIVKLCANLREIIFMYRLLQNISSSTNETQNYTTLNIYKAVKPYVKTGVFNNNKIPSLRFKFVFDKKWLDNVPRLDLFSSTCQACKCELIILPCMCRKT